jgi:hypothetical protein
MRRIRILALGFVSFFAVLMSALLAPGTFINRALSAALCTVFSFNYTICTVNLVNSSDRVVAATPPAVERNIADWLVQRDPGEFDDAPSVPSGSNPQAPPFPQDPGPNQPVRPDFDNPNGGNPDSNTGNQSRQCDTEGKIHVFYINGIRTNEIVYKDDWKIISNVLIETGIKNIEEHQDTYNADGISFGLGDFTESAIQTIIGRSLTPSGRQVVNHAVSEITKIDSDSKKNAKEKAENDCKCQPKKPRYLIIAHSQGNFFAKEVASTILNSKPEIFQRLSILSIASFTNYEGVIGGLRGGGRFEYMLRSKDFPFRYRDINVPLLTDVSNPGRPNIPDMDSKDGKVGEYQEPSKVLANSNIKDALLAHGEGVDSYLGDGSNKKYQQYVISVRESRKQGIEKIQRITSYDPGNYQSEQCQADKQSPQPQPTAQQPQQTPQQQLRACRVTGVEKYNNMTMNRGGCAIQGPVMTEDGPVDGKTQCGICNTFIGGLAPRAGSCQEGVETDPRIAFLGLNKPILCPPNWDSGY